MLCQNIFQAISFLSLDHIDNKYSNSLTQIKSITDWRRKLCVDYKVGFGEQKCGQDHWLGNDTLHVLTTQVIHAH